MMDHSISSPPVPAGNAQFYRGPRLPGIDPETVESAGILRVEAPRARELCGIPEAGVIFPYRNLDGLEVLEEGGPFVRLRLEKPRGSKKYHQRAGSKPHGYLPPRVISGDDLSTHIVIVIEGEKKALSLSDLGYCAIGISGFYGFADKEGELAPEIEDVLEQYAPNLVIFAGDQDVAFNWQFSQGAIRFTELLDDRFPVRSLCVPLNAPGKGFDDCRAADPERATDIVADAIRRSVTVFPDSDQYELALQLLEQNKDDLGRDDLDLSRNEIANGLAKLSASFKQGKAHLLADELRDIAEKDLGIARRTFNAMVKDREEKLRSRGTGDFPSNVPLIRLDEPNKTWVREALEVITHDTFVYAGNLCQLTDEGFSELSPAALASFVDDPEKCRFATETQNGLRSKSLSEANARLIAGAVNQNLDVLRPVKTLAEIPTLVLVDGKTECVTGYDRTVEIYARGEELDRIDVEEARGRILELLADFDFPSSEDSARAIALVLSPALARGGFLGNGRPAYFFVEKDEKGAGGGYLCQLVAALYSMRPGPVNPENPKDAKEDVSRLLSQGNSFIYLDNIQGRILTRLSFFESLLTEPIFTFRAPYLHGTVDVTREVFAGTSNGAQMSEDLADRTALIHLRKRPKNYSFKRWDEGDLLEHVNANREYYLQAVYALIDAWVNAGMPSGKHISGFRFREFERAVQWILENCFSDRMRLFPPDYEETKRRLADPDYDTIRSLLRAVLDQDYEQPLSATDFARIALATDIMEGEEDGARIEIGKILGRYFGENERTSIGEFTVAREQQKNANTNYKPLKLYHVYRNTEEMPVRNTAPPRPSFDDDLVDEYIGVDEPGAMD